MATTTFTSVSCGTAVACSATGGTTTSTTTTSTSPTPTLTSYYILPDDTQPQAVLDAFNTKITQLTDPTTLSVLSAKKSATKTDYFWWFQQLNDTLIEEFKADPAVLSIQTKLGMSIIKTQVLRSRDNGTMGEAFTHLHEKRAVGDIIDQVTTDDALKVISQPSGPQLGDCSTYSYEEDATGRAMVYVVDGGANAQHIEYTSLNPQPNWIWAGSPQEGSGPNAPYIYVQDVYDDWMTGTSTSASEKHGTCMLSRAVGPPYGVSKNSMVTIVRVTPSTGPVEAMAGEAMVSAYVQVFNDILSKGLGAKAVVIAANGFTATLAGTDSKGYPVQGHPDYPIFKAISSFAEVGVLVIAPSGNDGAVTNNVMTDAPAIWNRLLPVLTAGATTIHGRITPFTQWVPGNHLPSRDSAVNSWAPGYQVTCACDGTNGIAVADGTSLATAIIGGLVAYFLGSPKHYQKIKAMINAVDQTEALPAVNRLGLLAYATRNYVEDVMSRSVYVPQFGRVAHKDYGWDAMVWNGVQPLDANGNRFCPPASAKRQAQIGGNAACAAPVPTGNPISGIGPAASGMISILQHPTSGTVTLPSAPPGVGLPFSAILPILQSTSTADVSVIGPEMGDNPTHTPSSSEIGGAFSGILSFLHPSSTASPTAIGAQMGNNPPVGVLNFTCNVPASFKSAVPMDTQAMNAVASWCANINRNWPQTVTVDPLNLPHFLVEQHKPLKGYMGSIKLLPSLSGAYSGTLPPSCAQFSTLTRNFAATECENAFKALAQLCPNYGGTLTWASGGPDACFTIAMTEV